MGGIAGEQRLPAAQIFIVLAGIYTTQSVIGGLTFHGVPAVLRSGGTALDAIGLVSLFMLPWALKFLWAPAVERYRIAPGMTGRSRLAILVGQGIAIAAVAILAAAAPPQSLWLVFAALAVATIVTATVDIACDGFAVEQLADKARGWGNTAQVGGGYLGAMIGGGLFLVITGYWGWLYGIATLVAVLLLLSLPMQLLREPRRAAAIAAPHRPSLAYAFSRPAVRWGLLIVLLFQGGLRLSMGMIGPFLIDRQFDLAALGWVSGIGGTAASLAGTAIAGWLIVRFAPSALLRPVLLAQALLFLGFAAAAFMPAVPAAALAGWVLAKAFVTGIAFVALYAATMGWSSLRQAGVDFTLFQCADAAIAAAAGMIGGLLAEHLGYGACFGVAVALALGAALCLPALLARVESGRDDSAYAAA